MGHGEGSRSKLHEASLTQRRSKLWKELARPWDREEVILWSEDTDVERQTLYLSFKKKAGWSPMHISILSSHRCQFQHLGENTLASSLPSVRAED